jgi:hypothetical protein
MSWLAGLVIVAQAGLFIVGMSGIVLGVITPLLGCPSGGAELILGGIGLLVVRRMLGWLLPLFRVSHPAR